MTNRRLALAVSLPTLTYLSGRAVLQKPVP